MGIEVIVAVEEYFAPKEFKFDKKIYSYNRDDKGQA